MQMSACDGASEGAAVAAGAEYGDTSGNRLRSGVVIMGVPFKSGRVRLGRLVPGPAADGDVVPVAVTFPALAGALTKYPVASKEQMIPKVSFSMVPLPIHGRA